MWSERPINQKDGSLDVAKGSHCSFPASGTRIWNTPSCGSRGFLSKKTRHGSNSPQAEMARTGQSGTPRTMDSKSIAQPMPKSQQQMRLPGRGSYVAPKRWNFRSR